ncbi:WW domain-containing protein [Sarocladium implicatum]|nr:WW domain-containing protein [Sarocladium implicatum]
MANKILIAALAVATLCDFALAVPAATTNTNNVLSVRAANMVTGDYSAHADHPAFGLYERWLSTSPYAGIFRRNATAAVEMHPNFEGVECDAGKDTCFLTSRMAISDEAVAELNWHHSQNSRLGRRDWPFGTVENLITELHYKTYHYLENEDGEEQYAGFESYHEWDLHRRRERGRVAQSAFRKRQAEAKGNLQQQNAALRDAIAAIAAEVTMADRPELKVSVQRAARLAQLDDQKSNSSPWLRAKSHRLISPDNVEDVTLYMRETSRHSCRECEAINSSLLKFIGVRSFDFASILFWHIFLKHEAQHHGQETLLQWQKRKERLLASAGVLVEVQGQAAHPNLVMQAASLQNSEPEAWLAKVEARLDYCKRQSFLYYLTDKTGKDAGAGPVEEHEWLENMSSGEAHQKWLSVTCVESRIRFIVGEEVFAAIAGPVIDRWEQGKDMLKLEESTGMIDKLLDALSDTLPQQRVPLDSSIPQQQQPQQPQPQPQHQIQSQLQYAPQLAQAPRATLQQPQVVRSPTLSRKPVGQKAAIPTNAAPSPVARTGSVAPGPSAPQQQHAHVQVGKPSALQQQSYHNVQTTETARLLPTQHLNAVSHRPIQNQHQHQQLQQPQLAQQRPKPQALQQPPLAQTTQRSQSASAVLSSQHVQQINEERPPLPKRTVPALQPQQIPHSQQQHPHQQPYHQLQQQQSGNRVLVQTPRPNSTISTGPQSVSSGPSIITPRTAQTTPGTPNSTKSQWTQPQPLSNTGRPIQQQPGISTIFCNHCKTGIPSNVSTYTCLICSTANTLTSFCVWCFTSGAAATSHPHDKAYYVNESDLRIQLAPYSGVPTHLWTVKRNVTGTFWYTHNVSGYKTHVKPHVLVLGSTGLPPGWDERRTPDGRTFFFNNATRATSWIRPVNSLPPGWRELRTPDLVPFYVHDGMALASWERPGQQPKGRRSSIMGRTGTSNAGDSLKKMWGKLGKAQNVNMMARLAMTANNISDGNVQPEEGVADGGFEESVVEQETSQGYTGGGFGGDVQQDVQTDSYADNQAFQQANFATQEQPFTEAPEAVQQSTYEQPIYEQTTYEQPACAQSTAQQPLYEQASIAYQQPTYETGQQPPVVNGTSYLLQQPQPEHNQLYATQEIEVTPEQEAFLQCQNPYASTGPGLLENPYETAVQQELMLNQPTASLAQSQALLMQQMLHSTASTEQSALEFTPEEPIEVSIASGDTPQEPQEYIANYQDAVIEAKRNATNDTVQLIDKSQIVASVDQVSAESNLMVDDSQYNSTDNKDQVLVDNAQFNAINEIQQINIVDSARTLPAPVITEPLQIQSDTLSATCDIASLSNGVQALALDMSAQDAALRPNIATEPVANPSLEQKGVDYSLALI